MKYLIFVVFMGLVVGGSKVMYDSGTIPSVKGDNENNVPGNLKLPFEVENISTEALFVKPFGVVTNNDEILGYDGVGIALKQNTQIVAPKKGRVVEITNSDSGDGFRMIYIFDGDYDLGEGWGFMFDNVTPIEGVEENKEYSKGDTLAVYNSGSNDELKIVYAYWLNNYSESREPVCWVETLSSRDKKEFDDFYEDNFKNNQEYLDKLENYSENGTFPYQNLLNEETFPNGVRYCYPHSTDVRVQDVF